MYKTNDTRPIKLMSQAVNDKNCIQIKQQNDYQDCAIKHIFLVKFALLDIAK